MRDAPLSQPIVPLIDSHHRRTFWCGIEAPSAESDLGADRNVRVLPLYCELEGAAQDAAVATEQLPSNCPPLFDPHCRFIAVPEAKTWLP
jgi:hypothetical protein